MRQQPLIGFVLHQKPYRENRSLTYFFSQEFGLVHGVGKKNLPLFVPLTLFATGKSALKTFSQSQLLQGNIQQNLNGQALFAGLYLNELLVKLLPQEELVVPLWQAYQACLSQLAHLTLMMNANNLAKKDRLPQAEQLKFILRHFEQQLFSELGYAIDFTQDSQGDAITPNQTYRYQLQDGFVPTVIADKNTLKGQSLALFSGQDLQRWHTLIETKILSETLLLQLNDHLTLLNQMGTLYRQIVDNLLNHQPLQSRELWRQLAQYQ